MQVSKRATPTEIEFCSATIRGSRIKLIKMRRSTYKHFSQQQPRQEITNGSLPCNSKRAKAWIFQIKRCKHVQAIRKSKQRRLLQRSSIIMDQSWLSQTSRQSDDQAFARDALIPQKYWDELFEQALEAINDSSIDASDLI